MNTTRQPLPPMPIVSDGFDGQPEVLRGYLDGEFLDVGQYLHEHPPTLPRFAVNMTMHLKAGSEGLAAFTAASRRLPCPIDITIPSRRPKHRRRADGRLRPLIAGRTYRYVVHEAQFSGDNTGAPWRVDMRVTRRPASP